MKPLPGQPATDTNPATSFGEWIARHPNWCIVAVALAVWGHSVIFGFVWDDYSFIEQNTSIRSLRNIPDMFTKFETQADNPTLFNVYRPLRNVHYAVLWQLGGGQARPALYHAANVAWHALTACLLFGVACRLFRSAPVTDGAARPAGWPETCALWIALAYTVHPVLSETVCWAKGLDDIMAAALTLLATRWLLMWKGEPRLYWGAVAAFVAAIYSKESAVPWVAFAGLVFWLYHGRVFLKSVALTVPFAAVTLVGLWHRHLVMGRSSQTAPISGTHAQTLLDMFTTVKTYARVMLGIPPFCVDYSYQQGGHALTSGPVLIGIVVLLAVVVATVWALRTTAWRAAGLGGAWFLLFMLPVSNLVPMMQYMAERFLYLPMAGALAAIGAALLHARNGRRAITAAGAVCLLWAASAWHRSWAWEDEVTLFLRARDECPYTPRVEASLLAGLLKQPHMRPLFKVVPRPGQFPIIDLTSPDQRAGANWQLILGTLRAMEPEFPSNRTALNMIGIGYTLGGMTNEGVAVLQRAVAVAPNPNATLWANLGFAHAMAGQIDQAIAAAERGLAVDPANFDSLHLLANALNDKGDFKRAADTFDQLLKQRPGDASMLRARDEARAKAKP